MYDINTKNVKKGKKFYFIFLAAGLLFLIIMGGIYISSFVKKNSLDATTTSTRVEVNSHVDSEGSKMYSPTYYYTVDGKEYSCSSNSSSSINPGTKNKKVYYDSKNPEKCMTEYSSSSNNILLIFMLIPILFIVVAVINMRKVSKRLKLINELNQKGKLVKNLPYHLENTGMAVNNVQIQRPVVEYTLPSGSTIMLYGDPRHDGKAADADGMVDIVIDENNPDNYFVDFEINRLTGNLPTDYYNNVANNGNYQNVPNANLSVNSNNMVNNYSNLQQNQTIPQQYPAQAQYSQNVNQQYPAQAQYSQNINQQYPAQAQYNQNVNQQYSAQVQYNQNVSQQNNVSTNGNIQNNN